VKIHKTKILWIDAGIFGSHIGIESAVGKDSWNSTRNISADNSPYYELLLLLELQINSKQLASINTDININSFAV